jgi:GDPmannose 4,6-dehydratase
MRSALIIGAGGQDGRLLAPFLSDRGYAVRGWVRQEPGTPLSCEYAAIDISHAESIVRELRAHQPNEIYYLAAFHHSTEALIEVDTAELLRRSFDVHVMGLLNVLQAMTGCCSHARLFYAASSHVFGICAEERKDESSPLRPSSAYAISKTAGLRCCQLFRQQERIFAAIGILFNHESSLRKSSFVSQKIVRGALRARRDRAFQLTLGDIDARVDWGYAPDYVDAMFRILQFPEPDDFVVASGELHSVREFTALVFEEVGLDWRDHVKTDAQLLKRTSYPFRGDSAKLRAATGWSPSVSFRELVTNLVQETEKSDEIL